MQKSQVNVFYDYVKKEKMAEGIDRVTLSIVHSRTLLTGSHCRSIVQNRTLLTLTGSPFQQCIIDGEDINQSKVIER